MRQDPSVQGEVWRQAERRRRQFEAGADAYHRLRPRYPEAMYDDLARLAHLRPGAHVVEVGAGTGLATGPLVARGYRVTCIEPSARLADICRGEHGNAVNLVVSRFEDWTPPPGDLADLVFAATSWHWVEPVAGLAKARQTLAPGGALAVAWQLLAGLGPDGFGERVRETYDELAPELAGGWDWQETTDRGWVEPLVAAGFDRPRRSAHRFRRFFDAGTFVALTFTYGDHVALPAPRRRELAEALVRLVDDEFSGQVWKDEEAVLLVASRHDR